MAALRYGFSVPVTLLENPRQSTNSIVLEFGYNSVDPIQWELLRTTGCQSSCGSSGPSASLDDASALPNLRSLCRESCLVQHLCVTRQKAGCKKTLQSVELRPKLRLFLPTTWQAATCAPLNHARFLAWDTTVRFSRSHLVSGH